MIKYKIDILSALKEHGISTYRIRKDKLIPESTLSAIRQGEPVHWTTIDKICELIDCQPGDLLEYVREERCE